jgi:cytochrome c-type biogenesis protein CcmH
VTRLLVVLAAVFGAILTPPAGAQQSMPPAPYAYTQLEDPKLEAKARSLMLTLRCLKCQSQSIADSDAPMAGDMRHQVRSRLLAGEEPEEIRSWLVDRYGDYVSYSPEVSRTTWPLFVVPALLLAMALFVLLRRLGRHRSDADEEPLGEGSG